MVGLLKPTSQESEIRSAGNHLSNLLGQIRPHRLSLLSLFGAASGDAVAQNRPQARVPQPETKAALAERANASTVTVISGTVLGTFIQIANDMSFILDEGDRLRILPVIGKGA